MTFCLLLILLFTANIVYMFVGVSNARMGIHFGNLGVRVNGLIYYSLSPHEQKALAGIFSKGFPNTIRRIRSNIPTVVPR